MRIHPFHISENKRSSEFQKVKVEVFSRISSVFAKNEEGVFITRHQRVVNKLDIGFLSILSIF